MRCEEIMQQPVECVVFDDTCQLAAMKMREGNFGFLPVCGADGSVEAVITDRDLAVRLIAESRPAETKVWEVASRDVVSCRRDDEVTEIARLMGEREVSRVVVLDRNDRLIGVVSLTDLVRAVPERVFAGTVRNLSTREAREPATLT